MDIEKQNAALREAFHGKNIKGQGIVFDVLDSGAVAVDTMRPVNMTPAVTGDTHDHGTKVAWLLHEACPEAEIRSYYAATGSQLNQALTDILGRAPKETGKQHIVNISMVVNDKEEVDRELERLIDSLTAIGIPVVCAAGNDGEEKLNRFPSCFQSPYTVSAIQPDGSKCDFSTWHDEMDFAELGYKVLTKRADGATIRQSGTSFSSPILAGKIGLLLSEFMQQGRRLTDDELYAMLRGGAVDIGPDGRDPYYGWGYVNVAPGGAVPEVPAASDGVPLPPEIPEDRTMPKDIEAANAAMREAFHAKGYKGRDIVFAVFDTGVQPVNWLKGKVIAAMPEADTDTEGHGTWVAGNLIEWCPDATILSYNVIPDNECTPEELNAAVAAFLDHARADRARQYIVNMSLSGDYDPDLPEIVELERMLNEIVDLGIPVVVSAGNDGEERLNTYPSCFECPICVSSMNAKGEKSKFATWHNEVDFSDHGEKVWGTTTKPNSRCTNSGTSMSCPQVAGKLGLIMSMHHEQTGGWMTEAAAYDMLRAYSHDLGKTGRDPYFGWGFADIVPLQVAAVPAPAPEVSVPEVSVPEVSVPEVSAPAPTGVSAQGLCDWCRAQLGQIYVWGGNGQEATPAKIKSMETSTTNVNRAMALYNKRKAEGLDPILMYDCSGLISRYLQNNGIVDKKRNCDHLAGMCSFVRTSRSDGEMIPGDLVFRWKSGTEQYYHVGVYVGMIDGERMVIESKGRDDGVVLRKINASGSSYWNRWGRLAVFAGQEDGGKEENAMATILKVTTPYMRGDAIKYLQQALNGLGYPAGDADGIYGAKSEAAVKAFVAAHGGGGELPVKVQASVTINGRAYTGELEG